MSTDPRAFADYRLVASLGSGGMAHVHLAISARAGGFQKLLVLKTLRPEHAADPEFRRMFLDEAKIAARLNHPNVVHTYEVGEHDGQIFIAMEFLEGQAYSTVLTRVGRNELPIGVGVRILADTLAGLHYAHELQDFDGKPLDLVHRDVSPQNIFVTYVGHAKILDFGIAKGSLSNGNTQSGVIKGKVGYMAPEQVMGGAIDRRADIFAVGVTLWELLAKTRFVGKSEEEVAVITRRIQGRERSIREVAPESPAALLAICERAMALEPAARYPTALAMQEELEGYLAREGGGDARTIAALLDETFKEERSKVRRVVEESVKSDATEPLASIKTSIHTSSSVEIPVPTAVETTVEPEPRGRSSMSGSGGKGLFMGLGVVVLLGFGAVYALGRRSVRDPAALGPEATPAPAPSTSVVTSSSSLLASAPPAQPSAARRVKVTTSPKGAVLSLDGAPVDNPFDAPLSSGSHRFRAQALGFRTLDRNVTELESGDITLTLEPVRAAEAPAATGRPKKPHRDIDDTDPYK